MRKGYAVPETLVIVAAFAVILAVFIFFIAPKAHKGIKGAGETAVCEWGILASSFTKILGKETIPPVCKAEKITVDSELLKHHLKFAKQRMKEMIAESASYKGDVKRAYEQDVLPYFNNPNDEKQLYEFALNKVIAEQLRSCWGKVFQGKLDLFDEWYNKFDLRVFGILPKDADLESQEDFRGSWSAAGLFKVYGPPTFCILCSRIKFGKEVVKTLEGKSVKSLKGWLYFNPAPRSNEPYMKFLAEGREGQQGQSLAEENIVRQHFEYDVSEEEPLAVLYSRVNVYKAEELFQSALQMLGLKKEIEGDFDRLALIPFKNVAEPLSNKDIKPEEVGNCALIID